MRTTKTLSITMAPAQLKEMEKLAKKASFSIPTSMSQRSCLAVCRPGRSASLKDRISSCTSPAFSRSALREGGLPHVMVVATDLTRPLREEELQAWQGACACSDTS